VTVYVHQRFGLGHLVDHLHLSLDRDDLVGELAGRLRRRHPLLDCSEYSSWYCRLIL
jgi:hypothetical protein